jgi:hypothetical protein
MADKRPARTPIIHQCKYRSRVEMYGEQKQYMEEVEKTMVNGKATDDCKE